MFRPLQRFKKYEGRFLILFVLLVLATVLLFLTARPGVLTTLFVAIPLAGVYASSYDKRATIAAALLAIPAIVFGADQSMGTAAFAAWLAHWSAVTFYGFTAAVVLSHILRQTTITANTIYGALSVYLLLGFTWSFAYSAVDASTPESFYVSQSYDAGGVLDRRDYVYYSFVTLTTLGYGDIVPLSAKARLLAILEAIAGVLYTATLVASLVGRLAGNKTD